MISPQNILPLLTPFRNKKDVIIHDQDVSDIITGILATHNRYKSEYDKICVSFIGFSQRETLRNIWNFIKKNVRYKVEPESTQYLKSPSAIFTPGTTSDCKNMSLATGGIIDALNRKGNNIKWCYRFASYKLFDKVPGHVFVVVNPGTNQEIWIDAVLPSFDNHKSYYYKIDKKPDNMSLISLAGIGAKKTAAERKEDRKKFFEKLKDNVKDAGKIVIKYNPATTISRNAFLVLVKLNARSLATSLSRALNKPDAKTELFKIWEKIGGSRDVLEKAILEGAKKKRLGAIMQTKGVMMRTNPTTGIKAPALFKAINPAIVQEIKQNVPLPTPVSVTATTPTYPGYSGSDNSENFAEQMTDESSEQITDESSDESIGVVDPVSQVAAALAAASPILIAVANFLKKHKGLVDDVKDIVGIEDDAKDATKAEASSVTDVITKEAAGITTAKGSQIVNNAMKTKADAAVKDSIIKSKLPIMPIALVGGGILAFMLLKKKK
jgi:hypothetical protein